MAKMSQNSHVKVKQIVKQNLVGRSVGVDIEAKNN
jgi:hypothetical protein